MMLCAALFFANLLVAAARTDNYCGAKMCGHTNAHTFCQYPPGPSTKCVGYIDAQLTEEEKVRIIARLNRRRSEAASGMLRHMPSAGNMLKLRWVEELAREAQRWADQCRPPQTPEERDICRDLYSISVGQCVASVVGEAPGLRVESMVDLWYMQSMHYKENITSFVVPVSNVNYYGDFAQMIWAYSYMVGCGRSRFMAEVNGRQRSVERLVCNLAPKGPSAGRPLWTPAPPAAVCPPRSLKDPTLTSLCNFQADLDVSTDIDGALTIEEHVLLSTVLEMENKNSPNYLGSLDELYLTKLAIVTMENSVAQTLPYGGPVYKRNVIQTLYFDSKEVTVSYSVIGNIDKQHMNETFDVKREEVLTATPLTTHKEQNTIGRPKPYNMEELLDDTEQSTTEEINHDDTSERAFTIVDRDLYLDYNDISVAQETSTTSTTEYLSNSYENITLIMAEGHSSVEFNNTMVTTELIHVLREGNELVETYKRNETCTTHLVIETSTLLNNNTTADVNASLRTDEDDYLSDPETVREIQEALERMERSLEEPPQPSGKVRRELREPLPTYNQESTEVEADPSSPEDIPDQPPNKTIDKTPLLNMVMKYLPYLKPYEKEILGRTSAGSICQVSPLLSCHVLLIFSYVF